jgi:ABC-type glycerol-3-phosphate transport system substrate-binding protein
VSNKCRDRNILDKAAIAYRFIASRELRMTTYSAGKNIPVTPQIAIDATPSDRPQWNNFAEIGANAVLRPAYPDSLFTIEGDNMYTVFTQIILGAVNPAEALADLEQRYNAALDKAAADKVINLSDFIDPGIAAKFKYGR